jgi:hypothetical protein
MLKHLLGRLNKQLQSGLRRDCRLLLEQSALKHLLLGVICMDKVFPKMYTRYRLGGQIKRPFDISRKLQGDVGVISCVIMDGHFIMDTM